MANPNMSKALVDGRLCTGAHRPTLGPVRIALRRYVPTAGSRAGTGSTSNSARSATPTICGEHGIAYEQWLAGVRPKRR